MSRIARARVDGGRSFWAGSDGKWAGEQLLKALREGRPFSADIFRTYDVLRKDEWVEFDDALVEEATIRLRAVADLMSRGLTRPISNGLGKTVLEYEKVTDMDPAIVSLDAITRGQNDRQEFTLGNLPLPITHKDFWINIRTLMASRERGESLDDTQVRTAGRLVTETVEDMLINGGKTFGGMAIYGYRTHPDRNTLGFGHGPQAWSASGKTGEEILSDLLRMIQASIDDRMYGPWVLYIPRNTSTKMEEDFKSNSDLSIRQRLLETEGLEDIQVVDTLPADNIVLVSMTRDTVVLVEGEPLQTVQWDTAGGFQVNFKAFTIQVPLIRSDTEGRCGVVHMS